MTTTTATEPNSEALILKTDARGRMLVPPERREALLDEFERSGLSGAKYAALVGIKYSTFATWAQRRREQRSGSRTGKRPASKSEQVRWLEAVVQEAQGPRLSVQEVLVLQLPGGVRAEVTKISQVALMAAVIRELEKALPPC